MSDTGFYQRYRPIILLALVIMSAVLGSVWFKPPKPKTEKTQSQDQPIISFTEAVARCQQEARKRLGEKLGEVFHDETSSRFDNVTTTFRVFLRATLPVLSASLPDRQFFISCFVDHHGGVITRFDIFEIKPGKPIEKIETSPINES